MNTNPNDMQANPNDDEAKLTAYVLGELAPEEVATLEATIARDADLRREVEAIRSTTDQLSAAFAAEPSPGLTPAQRTAISAGAAPADEPPVIFSFRRWAGIGLAAAACLAVVALIPVVMQNRANDESFAVLSQASPNDAVTEVTAEADLGAEAFQGAGRKRLEAMTQEQSITPGAVAGSTRERGSAGGETVRDELERNTPGFGVIRGDSVDADQAFGGRRGPASKVVGGGVAGGGAPSGVPARPPLPSTAAVAPPPRDRRAGSVRTALSPGAPPAEVRRQVQAGEGGAGDRAGADFRQPGHDREAYGSLVDNPFRRPADTPLSTFSIDVDTASYSNVRRMLRQGRRVPPDAVRIEELINYFDYAYEPPSGDEPFSVNVETGGCPWEPAHRLVRIGLRGQDVDLDMRPATSLVFLIDVSGSMNQANKLPLLKESLRLLIDRLNADDRIGMVVYAGAAGVVLPPTYCDEKQTILDALDRLSAGGSTNGGEGIELAYRLAAEHFIEGGVNRVILCTDGDFNVGVSSQGDLDRLIEEKRTSGVFLSILGFGHGNWQDDRMETLSNKGNGNFAYIDSLREAKKVLVREMGGTLVTIAKDVKVQVEFNPAKVAAYRLIGYANRILAAEDFNDDTKDAGEIGAGHTVTALYEIVPPGAPLATGSVDPLKYQKAAAATAEAASGELMTVKLRAKAPDGDVSKLIEHPVVDRDAPLAQTTSDFRFAAAVAEWGMLLRGSEYRAGATYEQVLDLASPGLADDPHGDRAEFLDLVRRAQSVQR